MSNIRMTTERLVLKPAGIEDKSRLVQLLGDPRVSENLSNVPHPYTEQDANDWLRLLPDRRATVNIFLANDLIGGVSLVAQPDGLYELGYWLGVAYWGQGFATEACQAMLNYAEDHLQYNLIRATVYQDNPASMRVLDKIGFHRVGSSLVFSPSRQKDVPMFLYEYHKD